MKKMLMLLLLTAFAVSICDDRTKPGNQRSVEMQLESVPHEHYERWLEFN